MKTFFTTLVLFFAAFGNALFAEPLRLFIGTYTGGTNGSEGIYTSTLDTETGTLAEPALAAKCNNPAFLAMPAKRGQRLFAVGETGNGGKLYSFTYNKEDGQLQPVDEIEIPGRSACHLHCFFLRGATPAVIVANYSSGNVVSYPVEANGKFGKIASNIQHQGSGPNLARQKEPHPHGVFSNIENTPTVYVPDLGTDKVVCYVLESATAELFETKVVFVLPPGTGPRHLAFSKEGGRFVFVNGELNSTISVFALDEGPRMCQSISTLPEGIDGSKNTTAEIEVSPSGHFLYVSNRGHDSIAVFKVNNFGASLSLVEIVPSGGKHPRFFTLDPTGKFLLCCNKDSNNIVLFRVDRQTGKLTPTGKSITVSQPVCVKFAQ